MRPFDDEDAANPILTLEEDGRLVHANRAALDFFECGLDELEGDGLWKMRSEGGTGARGEASPRLFSPGIVGTEWRVGGRKKPMAFHVVPLEIEGRTVVRWIGIGGRGPGPERSNRNGAPGRGGTDAELFEAVLNAIPDVIGVQDRDHNIIRYNQAGYRFLGKTLEEVRGRKCYALIGHETPCEVCATTKAYVTKRPARVEKYVEEMDVWLDVRAYPILDESGEIARVIEHLRDITAEKRVEEALRESEARNRRLLEGSFNGIVVHRQGRVVYINRSGARLIGADDPEGLLGRPLTEFVHPEERAAVQERLQVLRGKGDVVPLVEQRLLRLDGTVLHVELTGTRMPYQGETAVWVIFRDITERVEAEEERERLREQLMQAQKMEAVGTLAGGMAHDFNNLLMGIQGRTSLMLSELDASHPLFEHLQGIETYIRNATDLTRQLLGFARGGKYEVVPTDLNGLLEESAEMFGRTKKEVRIHTKCPDDLWTVNVDRAQIEQVFLNLFINAWQAMPEGGDLFLQTKNAMLESADVRHPNLEAGPYVKVSVTDTGVGMDAATRQRIFEPFFTTKRMGRGTGLGLASAYGIIENHGGFIRVHSEMGEGTTFTVFLPADPEAQPEKTEGRVAGEILKGRETVLLVDDESMVLEVGRAMLAKLGYRVLEAADGREALDLMTSRAGEIHIVILDMIMPGLSGGETYDRLKALDPRVRVLLSSGYSLNGQAQDIMERGCDGFIQKPFDLRDLAAKVRSVLDRPV